MVCADYSITTTVVTTVRYDEWISAYGAWPDWMPYAAVLGMAAVCTLVPAAVVLFFDIAPRALWRAYRMIRRHRAKRRIPKAKVIS